MRFRFRYTDYWLDLSDIRKMNYCGWLEDCYTYIVPGVFFLYEDRNIVSDDLVYYRPY
ncbi:MAG: hypothetical protein KDH96_10240 [Candidatus Riesia sp.]|nr:hypothetical protein [Romboutsia sp.]MCB1712832.1 hypothetical protein [Candidatus Riesia sp.]